jgi:di/tricarboxylate transporter
MLLVVLRPRNTPPPPGDRVSLQLAVLGPPSPREVSVLAVVGLVLVGWTAGPGVGIDAGTVAVIGLCALFATRALDRDVLNDLPWDTIIFYGVVLSLGRLATNLGVDQLAANSVGSTLRYSGVPPLLVVFLVAGLTIVLRLVLLGEQAILLINLALIPLAPTLGVDPWVVVVTSLATGAMWYISALLPSYALAYNLSDGRLYSAEQGRRASFGYALVVLIGLAVSLPFWRLLGLV